MNLSIKNFVLKQRDCRKKNKRALYLQDEDRKRGLEWAIKIICEIVGKPVNQILISCKTSKPNDTVSCYVS